ncbi:THO complex, subunit THOC1 [Cordyceps fumosorosea ARSEF 2679]|uniref:THO complex, subunit THOC1 n=1 Tax=Cordyceps fumosorosea (strain ARSEF 2679) TaxID=1081104 RepID=A0A167RPL0_CORFA|nr:THO complex, subunit THOC1 [Cordyceps fumosorosea ARSEF 2679]OAA58804.1 THO complex, subunit THOC1 [Cordyceps fumosorosea ARSEF 2679]
MPAVDMDKPRVASVDTFVELLSNLLDEASAAKQSSSIEPALTKPDFADLASRVDAALPQQDKDATDSDAAAADLKGRQFAIVEGASRDLFGALIVRKASIPIDSPDFVRMWNFLDILSILSDGGQCDPALVFWLVEELLDSQTIAGCRHIFDFLESRRERMTAKNFTQKKLVILRSCNELLRRLSRAEDTAFCGRVFIFMFQCFPLGDRSSVNLRGEYHVENVTTYEVTSNGDATKMDIDAEAPVAATNGEKKSDAKENKESHLTSEELYPLLWSLQESFSQPTTLFDPAKFSHFQRGLEETMKAFESLHADDQRSLKRKRNDEGTATIAEAFNPKYLTSQDLFELEIRDLSFRRHVLVQALIITEFLLSLSTEGKQKLSGLPAANKAVVYSAQLSEENTKWATETKRRISEYLKQGFDGPYFFRMVETVLARDKNWVFWKMASCPPIEREPVTAADFVEAKSSAERMATSKRLRPTPMGAVSMEFLGRGAASKTTMDELRPPVRYQLPELETFQRPIADDDFEIDMPTSDATRAAAVYGKWSKSWRALRIASRTRLAAFDKIDDSKAIGVVFAEPTEAEDNDEDETGDAAVASEQDMPANRAAVVLTGTEPETLRAVAARLLDKHKGVFAPVVRHTTRAKAEGESAGKTFHFVSAQEFGQLRDGDRLVEHGERDGSDYGTSTKAIDAVTEAGKIPVLQLDIEAAQFAKDMDFEARYVLLGASEESETPYDTVIAVGSDAGDEGLDKAATELSAFLYGTAAAAAVEDDDEAEEFEDDPADDEDGDDEKEEEPTNGDADMADADGQPESNA